MRPIPIDGGDGCVEPTPETIASGEYPIARDLYIYVSTSRLAENPALRRLRRLLRQPGRCPRSIGAGEGQVPYVALSAEDAAATQAVWAVRRRRAPATAASDHRSSPDDADCRRGRPTPSPAVPAYASGPDRWHAPLKGCLDYRNHHADACAARAADEQRPPPA